MQGLLLFMSSVFVIIAAFYIKARNTKFDQRMDIFNEIKLIVVMYHMILFTDFVPDPETRYQIGFSCAGALIIGTAVNMFMLFVSPIILIRRYI